MKAELSIVRSSTCDDQEIRLIIRVAMGKTITVTISPEDLALTLTGKSDVPVNLRMRNLKVVQSKPIAHIFQHPAGKLFWAISDDSNAGSTGVVPVYGDIDLQGGLNGKENKT